MREDFLVTGDLIESLGGVKRVAGLIGVTDAFAYRYTQNPEKTGKPPSLDKFKKLICVAADGEDTAQVYLDELLRNITLPAKRLPVREEAFSYWEQVRKGIYAPKREVTVACNVCRNPVIYIGGNGPDGLVRFCPTCQAKGLRP